MNSFLLFVKQNLQLSTALLSEQQHPLKKIDQQKVNKPPKLLLQFLSSEV